MLADMEHNDREDSLLGRLAARRDSDADAVRDWLNGPGAMVLAVGAVIVLVVFAWTLLGDLTGLR